MGSIINRVSGKTQLLEQDHSVGRSPSCALCLPERYVSAQHALFRWTLRGWALKDLGSRNGTYVDGERLPPGEFRELSCGQRTAFGKLEQEWELYDATEPKTMVVPLDHGEPVVVESELIAIPSPDEPSVTIYKTQDACWMLEEPLSTTPLVHQQTFNAAGRSWKFCAVETDWKTSLATCSAPELRRLRLVFSVSKDEEYVHIVATDGVRSFDLGDRTHNYLLLILARQRLSDALADLPESARGWVSQDDFQHDPSMAPAPLNIAVFRIRRQFAALGLGDAASIIERRPRTRQLRIGVAHLAINAL